MNIKYININKLDFNEYKIGDVSINNKPIDHTFKGQKEIIFDNSILKELTGENQINITLI